MASRRHAYARREERASIARARSERGASFVVALLLMLVCSVVAAVIVLLWNFFAKKLMYRKKPNKE